MAIDKTNVRLTITVSNKDPSKPSSYDHSQVGKDIGWDLLELSLRFENAYPSLNVKPKVKVWQKGEAEVILYEGDDLATYDLPS